MPRLNATTDTHQDFHFPKAGVHQAGPFGRQPTRKGPDGVYVRTTADAANVRSFDHTTGRFRGASRPGLTKLIDDTVSDERWVVQDINVLVNTEGTLGVQLSQSGRVVYLLAVSEGDVKVAVPGGTNWSDTVNNSGETPPLNITGVMQSSPLNQKMFFCDGTNYVYYTPVGNSVEAWTASTAGTLPRDDDNNGCRLITTWRGRLVMSGLLLDPQNWFMSRISDPFDWEYSPAAITAGDPVAGNVTERFGLIGDVVTALIPLSDDTLLFGCDHTIHMMRGDPADGGRVDLLSDVTGVAFGQAWCKDPFGNAYFFGGKPSVWRVRIGGLPERISQPIDPLLADVDTGNTVIRMAWDHTAEAVQVYLTPADAADNVGSIVHWTFETRTGSWFKTVFAETDHNPLCCCEYDGNLPDDRKVLLGHWDGYVRKIDPEATTDDGTAITSSVLLGPIMTAENDQMRLKELQFTLGADSGQVTWEVLAADTPEQATAASARISGTASAGRNNTQPARVAAHALFIRLSSVARWAFENVRARFAPTGKVKRRN